MTCAICNKPVSSYNKGDAEICNPCRESHEPWPVVLYRLENGQVHLNLDPEIEGGAEIEKIVETIPAFLPKGGIALLRDIQHRITYGKDDNEQTTADDLETFLWDIYPTMLAKALAPKQ